ncbi:hypothetical protein [Carnobacterium divergens]|uniref:hypothetical protein n=1 Tax=Carnobacterium divergens TaxID=2748 RepID=UPI00288E60AC|nr:hypothetical protein [Carnobacterium divergens]MDT2012596.1 hypothetical protein [Carnobacterium divergens]
MKTQKSIDEYNLFGKYLEEIRRGKKIPLRIFDDNGLSSRTFQRFVKGESDIRITDLALIVEILSISPFECTEKLMGLSTTVTHKTECLSAIYKKDFQRSTQLIKEFKEYIQQTPFTSGKEETLYKILSSDFLLNPHTEVSKNEINILEHRILKRLHNATVYTLFDLDFLSFLQLNGINQTSPKLFLKVLKTVNTIPLTDNQSTQIVGRALINMLINSIKTKKHSNILLASQLFESYVISDYNWYMFMWKKIAKYIKKGVQNEELTQKKWHLFKQDILSSINIFVPPTQITHIQNQLNLIESYLID